MFSDMELSLPSFLDGLPHNLTVNKDSQVKTKITFFSGMRIYIPMIYKNAKLRAVLSNS